MGRYIDQLPNGKQLPSHLKAEFLLNNIEGARIIQQPEKLTDNLVCVVDNRLFEAAAYIYSNSELDAFSHVDDMRPKKWLIVPNADKLAS